MDNDTMKENVVLVPRLSPRIYLLMVFFAVILSGTLKAQLPTAQQIASEMGVGFNIGNTLEAICNENAWGNPNITQTFVNGIKNAGFKNVRLPVAWNCHADANGNIDPNWMARVKTVVDYCMNANLYVTLNIHWDNGWLENNITTSAQASVNARQQKLWTQIANTFKNYDKRVLFASANEPDAWDATAMSVLLSYHQTFINAVRATGGNNSSRTLIIQGPDTDPETTYNLMNTMPTDQIANRLMVEVHYYQPYQYCLMDQDADWGKMFYYWGNGYHSSIESDRNATWGEESEVERLLGFMKTKFVDKGIPVIIGEFLAIQRTNPRDLQLHINSTRYYHKYVVNSAKNKGILCMLWDTGALIDRNSGSVKDQETVNALMEGYGGSCTPTTITPYMQVGGTWTQTSSATVASGATVILGPQPSSGGSWSWSGMASGTSREVTLTPTSSGTATATYTNASGCQSTQVFTITVSGGSTSYVTIRNRATNLLIDGMGRTSAGSACGQYASSGSWNQMWTLETSGAYVYIKNRNTGLYIDGRGNSTNGAFAGQWTSSTSNNLQWQQETVGSYVKFKNRATGLYLDGMGNTTNGADLGQWASSTSNNQQWTVSAVTSAASEGGAVEVRMENMSTSSLIAYPNPVTDRIKITLPEEMKEAAITILNASGNVMIREKASGVSHTLDMTQLPAGLYLVRARKGVKNATVKIIKE